MNVFEKIALLALAMVVLIPLAILVYHWKAAMLGRSWIEATGSHRAAILELAKFNAETDRLFTRGAELMQLGPRYLWTSAPPKRAAKEVLE